MSQSQLRLKNMILQIKPNPISEHCRPSLCANLGRMLKLVLAILIAAATLPAKGPVYVVLWFDTEDYIEPAADDAALRIATDLENLGVRATFKVVGEKARVLEARGRRDVIRALSRHDVGYHSNFHSILPTPALSLRDMGWFD